MTICIFDARAIGAYIGVKLAQAGPDLSLGTRGAYLAAMPGKGLTPIGEGGAPWSARPLSGAPDKDRRAGRLGSGTARITDTPARAIDTVLALTTLHACSAGLYHG